MERRLFLQFPLMGSALIASAKSSYKAQEGKGDSMEEFFKQMAKFGKGIPPNQEQMKALWSAHGMEIVGPPLKF